MVAKGKAGQEDAVQQPLKQHRLTTPPKRKADHKVVAGIERGANPPQVRFPRLIGTVSAS